MPQRDLLYIDYRLYVELSIKAILLCIRENTYYHDLFYCSQ